MSETLVSPRPPMTVDVMVEKFIALRDKIVEVKKRQADELNPYNLALGTLEAKILDHLNTAKVESVRVVAGTAYKSTKASVKVVDWTSTLEFIKDKGAWDLLEARVSKTAAEAIMAETQQPIPGVSASREITLSVRRS